MRKYQKILLANLLLALSFWAYLYLIANIELLFFDGKSSFIEFAWLPIYLMPLIGLILVYKITKNHPSLKKKLLAGLFSFIFLSIALVVETVWSVVYIQTNAFSKNTATLELINESDDPIKLITVSLNNQKEQVINLNKEESIVLEFDIGFSTDEQYLFEAEFDSGKTLHLKGGYHVYGADSNDQAIFLNDKITLQKPKK